MPRNFKILLAVAGGLNGALWLLGWFAFPIASPVAVLHYSPGVGIDFIGEGRQIMVLPLLGLGILIGNFLLAALVWRSSRRASFVLGGMVPAVQVVLLAAVWLLRRFNL